MLILCAAGTNPIHNKKPKKKPVESDDEEDKAHKAKMLAGMDRINYAPHSAP